MLSDHHYFCNSSTMTVVDVVFFNELYLIVKLLKVDLTKVGKTQVLDKWYSRMTNQVNISQILQDDVEPYLKASRLSDSN